MEDIAERFDESVDGGCLGSGTNDKELGNDFKGHAFGFRNLEEDKYPRDNADDGINAKDAG